MIRQSFDDAKHALSRAHERGSSLCDPFLTALPVTGASVSILSPSIGQATVDASDPVAARLDEMQFDLGEGPCWSAMSSHGPVASLDIRHSGDRWPIFSEAVRNDPAVEPVSGMFAFPLAIGNFEIGAIDLYTDTGTALDDSQLSDASALASIASWQVLRRILTDQDAAYDNKAVGFSRRTVHQATGMILVQVGCSADEAELLLRAHAFSSGRTVDEVAHDVIDRRLDFSEQFPLNNGEVGHG